MTLILFILRTILNDLTILTISQFFFFYMMDLERVLEFEPWSCDKSRVVFQRVMDVESIPSLAFDSATFWVQLYNVPKQCLIPETGEAVGNTIGSIMQVDDLEDDGEGGEFLQIRVTIDITKPLPRCCKLWSAEEHVS